METRERFMNITEHLLTCLSEEGIEIAKDCSKALRFGLADRNVLDPTGPTNRERIIAEMNDFMGVVHLLVEAGIIPLKWKDAKAQSEKQAKVRKFVEYAKGTGALQ